TLAGVHGALLMAHQHVDELVILEERIVDRQHGSAGVTEDVTDALIFERSDDDFSAGQFRSRHRFSLYALPLTHTGPPSGPETVRLKRKGRYRPLKSASTENEASASSAPRSQYYVQTRHRVRPSHAR